MKKALIIIFTIGLIIFISFGLAVYFEIKSVSKHPSQPLHYEKDYQKEDTSIKKLQVNSQLADVKVKHGQHFSVKVKSGDKEHTEITSEIKNDTLIVKESQKGSNIIFNVKGIKQADITITVPDRMLEKADLYSDTSDIIIKSINGDTNIDTNTDTGDIELDYANAPKNTKLIDKTDEDNGSEIKVNQPQLKDGKYGQAIFKVQVDTDTGKVIIN